MRAARFEGELYPRGCQARQQLHAKAIRKAIARRKRNLLPETEG